MIVVNGYMRKLVVRVGIIYRVPLCLCPRIVDVGKAFTSAECVFANAFYGFLMLRFSASATTERESKRIKGAV